MLFDVFTVMVTVAVSEDCSSFEDDDELFSGFVAGLLPSVPGLSSPVVSVPNNVTVPNTLGFCQPFPVVSNQLNVPIRLPDASASLICNYRPTLLPTAGVMSVHAIATSST